MDGRNIVQKLHWEPPANRPLKGQIKTRCRRDGRTPTHGEGSTLTTRNILNGKFPMQMHLPVSHSCVRLYPSSADGVLSVQQKWPLEAQVLWEDLGKQQPWRRRVYHRGASARDHANPIRYEPPKRGNNWQGAGRPPPPPPRTDFPNDRREPLGLRRLPALQLGRPNQFLDSNNVFGRQFDDADDFNTFVRRHQAANVPGHNNLGSWDRIHHLGSGSFGTASSWHYVDQYGNTTDVCISKLSRRP